MTARLREKNPDKPVVFPTRVRDGRICWQLVTPCGLRLRISSREAAEMVASGDAVMREE